MRTLHLYLLRQTLIVLGAAIGVFVGVLLLGNALKDIPNLLVSQQVSLGTVIKVLSFQLPWLLSFAIPLALLAAVLLVFGRLSADQELTAIRSGGISLSGFAWPVLALGLIASGLSGWINLELAPKCRIASKRVLGSLAVNPVDLLVPKRYIREFPQWTIYVNGKDDDLLKEVLLHRYDENGDLIQRLEAVTGEVRVVAEQGIVEFTLRKVQFYWRSETGNSDGNAETQGTVVDDDGTSWETMFSGEHREEIAFGGVEKQFVKPDLSEMSYGQLRQELVRVRSENAAETPIIFHLHRQVASSFACFGFVLIGVPLGIRAHRRETSVGLALALLVALVYYAFQAFAQSLDTNAAAHPHLLVWLPNFVFTGLGIWLFWRANQGISA
jgi:lipopolysaccharide export system permease protein